MLETPSLLGVCPMHSCGAWAEHLGSHSPPAAAPTRQHFRGLALRAGTPPFVAVASSLWLRTWTQIFDPRAWCQWTQRRAFVKEGRLLSSHLLTGQSPGASSGGRRGDTARTGNSHVLLWVALLSHPRVPDLHLHHDLHRV